MVLVNWCLEYTHVKDLIPIGIQGLLDYRRRLGLLTADGSDCERVWKACIAGQHVAL